MPDLEIESDGKPVFLFQKFNGQPPQLVIAATLALVSTFGKDIVFGRIFRWVIDPDAAKVIEADTEKELAENGMSDVEFDHEMRKQAVIANALRVIMCHEMYVMDGGADRDAEQYNLKRSVKSMTACGRMHEDELATLISPGGCLVTTRDGLMRAMYGMKFERADTTDTHSTIIFYDDGLSESDDDNGNDLPNINLDDVDLG